MNKVLYQQYNRDMFPLARYKINDIPMFIWDVIYSSEEKMTYAIRGGLAYSLLTGDLDYTLKDIDLLYPESDLQKIVIFFSNYADIVYVNNNYHLNTVITSFWKATDNLYYKIDALVLPKLPTLSQKCWNGHYLTVVDIISLWQDRIEKISQKKLRNHSDEKTLNHLLVTKKLMAFMLKEKDNIQGNLSDYVLTCKEEVIRQAKNFLSTKNYVDFKNNLDSVLSILRTDS